MPTEPQPQGGRTRYQHVQQTLDEAAGSAEIAYQGYGKFWKLPLPEFLQVVIYGVRMIAPPPAAPPTRGLEMVTSVAAAGTGSCCGGSSTAATASAHAGTAAPARRQPGRGAASGLVRGLRGLPPFDGVQFPRLPWGGKPVAAADIQFIEDWIDDGCPDEAETPDSRVAQSRLMALHHGDADHPRSPRPINEFHDASGTPKKRKNIACLTDDELRRFRNAVREMHRYDAYFQDERSFNYWARIHANLCQHGWEEFLTWHRLYLYFFELRLQDVDASVTLPYWDWTMYDQDWDASTLDSGVIPQAYQCWIDQDHLDQLRGKVPDDTWNKLNAVKDQKFNSGLRLFKAAGITYVPLLDPTTLKPAPPDAPTNLIVAALQDVNPLWHRLRWPGPGGKSGLFFEGYPRPDDVARILQIENFFTFGSGPSANHFFGALENVHNLLHNFSGGMNPIAGADNSPYLANPNYDPQNRYEPLYGDMVSAGVTAFDPIFWGHHSNVDRLWAEWQTLHPGVEPDDGGAILPPWNLTVGDSLQVANLGYEYVKSEHLFETNSALPFTRFRSAPAGVLKPVLSAFRKAEIRVHRVKFSVHGGGFIRAFLNQPDASVETPTRGNDHYVGQVALFSGVCVGGPGHCEPPAGPPRKFDRRPRHHKTPANLRFDATDAVRRLVAAGQTDLRVNLVALDLDGKPKDRTLWMDGVSLVFLD
jgi:tyrosinase